jgi:3-deoxy-manno-octulosonate cytidylyltransferase (CMP-KDO synthetase)
MKDFKFMVCIPARYASTRLPGKPLIELKGKALILWAIEAANQLGAEQVVVATDDSRIQKLVESRGHQAVMTDAEHQSGTDRIAECASIMGWSDATWVLNYQGDEPNISLANVQQVINLVKEHSGASIGTLYQSIDNLTDLFNPNIVKLITDDKQRALYFSRAPIPWAQKEFREPKSMPTAITYKHHIGLYMYKVGFLKRFAASPVATLEKTESLEQLRALAMGETIVAAQAVEAMPHGIDTAEDVDRFEKS